MESAGDHEKIHQDELRTVDFSLIAHPKRFFGTLRVMFFRFEKLLDREFVGLSVANRVLWLRNVL
jgi:hypothetical protein